MDLYSQSHCKHEFKKMIDYKYDFKKKLFFIFHFFFFCNKYNFPFLFLMEYWNRSAKHLIPKQRNIWPPPYCHIQNIFCKHRKFYFDQMSELSAVKIEYHMSVLNIPMAKAFKSLWFWQELWPCISALP